MRNSRLFAIIATCVLSFAGLLTPLQAQSRADDDRLLYLDRVKVENVDVATNDNLILKARLYRPRNESASGVYPTVIFGNSWVLAQYEYELPARFLASKGYIVLNYTTRGFRGSQGAIGAGGPKEVGDISTLIDWVLAHTKADINNIALGGISYGGGIALLGGAHDPRVKTAVAMNAWGDMVKSLASNNTPHTAWIKVLGSSGRATGTLDPEFESHIKSLLAGGGVEEVREFAEARSPLTYVDEINAKGMPVFVANSYQDELFPPLQMQEFYTKLTGPKFFYMDKGVHASSAIPGLFGRESEVWNRVYAWLDHYLVDSKVPIKHGMDFHAPTHDYYYQNFDEVKSKVFSLKASNRTSRQRFGGIEAETISLNGNDDSKATSGTILLSELLTVYRNDPPAIFMPLINKRDAAVFKGERLSQNLSLIGSPKVSFTLGSHATPVQVVAYLYDVDLLERGHLVTYGVTTIAEPSTGVAAYTLSLEMNDYIVKSGHRLVVVFDTKDPLYTPPTKSHYTLNILPDIAGGVSVEIPYQPL